ncbi:MAG TPA: S8 family serine peptidase, partial [Candidatus Kryptobacter bacterium]|nr:S8 family serine peptidase [Candidatus Kryptobacter bacterium]
AGIVAAVANNHIGVAGVAPHCRIMAVKVTEADLTDPSTGEPYVVYGFEGIIYAADHGARVINCSWGGVGYSQYEQDVIDYATAKGALVVSAAGNDHSTEFQTPAYYDNVLSVAATDQSDLATYFTNYSYNVSVSAPGLAIWSTYGTDSYAELSGTSMASPCAAGVAALVASEHPNYTPQQVLEQVRVSADNIDDLNTSYVHMLGFGRVDAYRALTVSSPAVELNGITLSDSIGGNNDGVFTDGETVRILGTATDWLSPTSNLVLTLTTNDPYVTIVNGTEQIGSLHTDGTYDLGSNPLSFKVNSGTPAGHVATFVVEINDGSYSDYKGFTVLLNPTFRALQINNIATTATAKGNIGFNDYPSNMQGNGFSYLPDNDSLLFEGAFMAGTSASQVVDVARDSTTNAAEEDNDFQPVGLVSVQTPGQTADQESILTFNDSNATSNRIGIQVTLHTYAYHRDSTDNFIVLQYKIHNLDSARINNFYAGLFLDWDIGPSGQNNIAAYDSAYQLGYAYNTTRVPRTYTGCALIGGASPNYMAIDNAAANGIYNGFSKLYKWEAL